MPPSSRRRWLTRLSLLAFVFCLLNLVLSIKGGWSLTRETISRQYVDSLYYNSGIFSEDGRLVIAVDSWWGMYAGLRPKPWPTTQTITRRGPSAALILSSPFTEVTTRSFNLDNWHREALRHSWGFSKLGFIAVWEPASTGSLWKQRGVAIPWWFLCVVFAAVPAVSRTQLMIHRRRCGITHCVQCGYDLRATPARCPECGTVPSPPKPIPWHKVHAVVHRVGSASIEWWLLVVTWPIFVAFFLPSLANTSGSNAPHLTAATLASAAIAARGILAIWLGDRTRWGSAYLALYVLLMPIANAVAAVL